MSLLNSISLIGRKAVGRLLASVLDFIERVDADGGTVESPRCVNNAIQYGANADTATQVFDAYSLRVVNAFGTTEGRDCTINELNEIL